MRAREPQRADLVSEEWRFGERSLRHCGRYPAVNLKAILLVKEGHRMEMQGTRCLDVGLGRMKPHGPCHAWVSREMRSQVHEVEQM